MVSPLAFEKYGPLQMAEVHEIRTRLEPPQQLRLCSRVRQTSCWLIRLS